MFQPCTTTILPLAWLASMTRCASRMSSNQKSATVSPAACRGDFGAISCNGTSDRGNPGVPNTKLPKNVKYTPLAICRSGLKSWIGARPPSHPAGRRARRGEACRANRQLCCCRRGRGPRRASWFRASVLTVPAPRSRTARRRVLQHWESFPVAGRSDNSFTGVHGHVDCSWPKDDVAPRISRVWPLAISRLRNRQVQAVAYVSGMAASSAHGGPTDHRDVRPGHAYTRRSCR